MADILLTDSDKDEINQVLATQLPEYRKAFSYRTALLMAVMSEVAYVVWEKRFPNLDDETTNKVRENIIDKLENARNKQLLTDYLDELLQEKSAQKSELISCLAEFDLKVDEQVSWLNEPQEDTQGFIAFNDEFAILAFRGTEKDSFSDIRTDASAALCQSPAGGLVHEGFQNAFTKVWHQQLKQALEHPLLAGKPLYVTGHSLGGALATVAARQIPATTKIAACYTFGSPRVGNDDWINRIKSPIYRIVNAADAVPMLPPGAVAMSALDFVTRLIPGVGEAVAKWLSQFGGYVHAGNMRYLTNCVPGNYQNVKLLYSVSVLFRLKASAVGVLSLLGLAKKLISDHSIRIYRQKLQIIALKRLPKPTDS
ncbi:lipase family protein [Thalassotalea euphylliae]|uniref:Lipase family protein n=1 Tax=Thalassotalea euphylliae TaxID=1655234 RepID=A0A3E0TPM5_9GAMM|nr:lipase family protein [Thalassotalea euphylliae]REL26499.1 lipase family protein [Thalassotalea euphylliae]